MDAQERSPLTLSWQQQSAVLDGQRRSVELGAAPDGAAASAGFSASADSTASADCTKPGDCLRVTGPFTSRRHATIERRKHYYVLVDHSTNGTFVQTEDERVAFVRRGEVRLWGDGWISLGSPLSDASAIRFSHD